MDMNSVMSYSYWVEQWRNLAGEMRKIADDTRCNAVRDQQRADEARRQGREQDARSWENYAWQDAANADRRDRLARDWQGVADQGASRAAQAVTDAANSTRR